MGFPENEWHGHDLTSVVDGAAERLWGRLKGVAPWDDLDRPTKHRVKEAVLPNVIDVLDVIHERGLEALTTVNNPLLDRLEEILSDEETVMGSAPVTP
jgi:hypothetical protein